VKPNAPLFIATALVTACSPGDFHPMADAPHPPAGAREIVVTTTIQDAIDEAGGGDVVRVPAGTWHEDILIDKGISVIGAGPGRTTLEGSVTLVDGITSVNVASMTILSPTWASTGSAYADPYGIQVEGGDVTFFWDLRVRYFEHGVDLDYPGGFWMWDSEISNNWHGVHGYGCVGLRLYSNLIASNPGAGVYTQYTSSEYETHVVNNTFVGNGFGGAAEEVSGALALSTNSRQIVANNIVVSNAKGIDCSSCQTPFSYNLVWGNVIDYAGDASASPTDLSVDPLFSGSEGAYHLTSASPCIDAGAPMPVAVADCDGDARPQGASFDIGYDEFVPSGTDLLITEVLANASVESTGEFVEIYNAGAGSVDLAGLKLGDGGDLDTLVAFDAGPTTVSGGDYAVVVDPEYPGNYAIDPDVVLVTTGDTTLGNGLTTSDRVTLYEADGTTVAATFTQPSDPGDGVSLERVDLAKGDVPGNWRASVCPDHMSPGGPPCFAPSGDPAGLVVTEVMANAKDEATGEFVEIYNPTTNDIDLAGLVLADSASSDVLVGYQGGSTLVAPASHAVVIDPDFVDAYHLPSGICLVTTSDATLGNGLSNASDTVKLLQSDGSTVISEFSWSTDTGNGISFEKRDYAAGDGPANWTSGAVNCSSGHSVGRLNGAAGGRCEALLVTEVMANAIDEDTGEFIELYNAGSGGVELDGLVFTDGDASDALVSFAGGNSFLEAGEYALILDSEYAGDYDIPSGTILMRTLDTTLGNSLSVTDPVTLYESDGVHVLDAFRFPANPGNGISMDRVQLDTLDDPDSWAPSVCPAGASPGAAACGGGWASLQSDLYRILHITEIMANPLDESTGEFVELYNDGSTPVDLAGFVLFDGDATDTIQGFNNPTDTILGPQSIAVILDSGYTGGYTIPANILLLTTDDAALASGLSVDDPIYLYEPNGISFIDSFTWPFDPGNGISVEKIDPLFGDRETNWAASVCAAGSSPGNGPCFP